MLARALFILIAVLAAATAAAQDRPNVVLIYADDLGYGDVSAYGARRLSTPNIDRLAREGRRFTDAHSAAATCTPSRYAMLTGEYAFRRPGTGILPGDAALIVEPGRTTLPALFDRAGYATGVVGKWHLGLGAAGGPDWNGDIGPGPLDVGFDYAFVMPATGDRVPTVYVENRRVVNLDPADPIAISYAGPIGTEPTGRARPDLLALHPSHGHDQTIVNGISRIGYMTGGRAARWKDEEMADVFTARAVGFLERHRAAPFFLFLALHDLHVPRVPHPRFRGATPLGARGDAIVELDWTVGEILRTLDRLGLTDDTLVLLSSDNGPVLDDGYRDEAATRNGDHTPAGPWRGGKGSNFEGGTRVPFLLRWPARVKPGVSEALVSQVDLVASFAALLGTTPGPRASDSENVLPALLGRSEVGRRRLVQQAGSLALRDERWKYIAPGTGAAVSANTGVELGNAPEPQLYDLAADPGERRNLAASLPEKARELAGVLESIRGQAPRAGAGRRPNIVVAIADDWSFGHAGAYGDRAVRTPNFDRVAREGALFTHAFTASPSCTPSRAALLTGQAIHRLDESGNLWSTLRRAHAVYPDLLEAAGYAVGHTGKGWGPGRVEPGGRDRNPAGPRFESFDAFLRQRPDGRPFCFWFGSSDPHRPYAPGTGATLPAGAAAVTVPPFLPDTPEVRADLLDYSFEVERFDRDIGALLAALERIGELEHTIVVVTSDNGMPFPRAKANVYDAGSRMPLAIRWPAAVAGGTRVEALVSLTDLAPTLLEAAGERVPAAVTGRSLLPLLRGGPAPPDRDRVFIERERHANVRRGDGSYPVRAIRTREYLYVRNLRPDRAPAGDPELVFAVGPFGDIDGGPTKSLLLDRRADPAIAALFALATAARPADELYHLASDPHQLTNVAGRPEHEAARLRLRGALEAWMRDTGDPRAADDDDRWDRFPYYGPPAVSEGGLPGARERAAVPGRRRLRPRRGAPASSR